MTKTQCKAMGCVRGRVTLFYGATDCAECGGTGLVEATSRGMVPGLYVPDRIPDAMPKWAEGAPDDVLRCALRDHSYGYVKLSSSGTVNLDRVTMRSYYYALCRQERLILKNLNPAGHVQLTHAWARGQHLAVFGAMIPSLGRIDIRIPS